jgi:hypothetical protein
MSLAETGDKQLGEFLNSASVSRDAETVTLQLSYSSERLAQMLHNAIEDRKPAPPPTPEEVAAAKNAELFNGDAIDQWQAEATPNAEGKPAATASRTIEKVTLKNGAILSLGRQQRGKPDLFDRIEITPANGGTPLTFQTKFMTRGGIHGNFTLLQFPGADGTYTLKVTYRNDPTGKAKYTVSVRQPKPAAETETPTEQK